MSHPRHSRPSDAESIAATAAAWLAQRDDGLTPEQAAELARWRAADPRHEAAVAHLEATWSALQQLREYRPEAACHPDRDLLRSAPRPGRRWSLPALAAPLALAAALAVAALWWHHHAGESAAAPMAMHATTVDGYERVALADGSLVELNAASEVGVALSAGTRRVRLVRGEAHFTVAKDPGRPFEVEVGAVTVRAVGTAFNIRRAREGVEVLVTEGRVAVAATAESARVGRGETGNAGREPVPPTELGANERLVVPPAGLRPSGPPVVERLTAKAVREALAWQSPRLVFLDTPLAEAIAQFNRRNTVQIELADSALGALPIGGNFRADHVDAFVRLLISGGDVVAETTRENRIVLRRAPPAPRRD